MKVTVIEIKQTLSAEEYLNKIRPYLKDIINNVKKSDTWKIQLTIANKFFLPQIMMKSLQRIQKVIT